MTDKLVSKFIICTSSGAYGYSPVVTPLRKYDSYEEAVDSLKHWNNAFIIEIKEFEK